MRQRKKADCWDCLLIKGLASFQCFFRQLRKNVYFTINRSSLPLNSAESQHPSYSLQHPEIFSSLLSCPLSLLLHCLSGGALGACCLCCVWGQQHEKVRSSGEPPLRGLEMGSCGPFLLLSGRPGPSAAPLPVSCPGTGAEGPIPAL